MGDDDGRAGGKIIVTHRKPHLDEVVASWLLRNYDPDLRDCQFEFVANSPTGGNVPTGDEYIPLGVGRGKYDEHGMKAGQSATKLVYDDLLERGLIPNDPHLNKALEWLVDYAHKEDTGQIELHDKNYTSFSIPSMLRGVWMTHHGNKPDHAEMRFGLEMIDGLVQQLTERAKFLADWDNRIEFESKWGKAVALHSTFRGSDVEAYNRGFMLRVQTDPTRPFGDFRSPASSDIDLSSVYDILNKAEPGTWYLHQSHKIVTASMDAKAGNTTKFTLNELIDLVRK